jgi:hypothetical protein
VQRAREGGAAFVLVLPLAAPGASLPAIRAGEPPAAPPVPRRR